MFRRLLPVILAALVLAAPLAAAAGPPRRSPDAALPVELKDVPVQARFLALPDPTVGALQRLKGYAVVSHGADQAYWAATADGLYLRDTVYTLTASQCLLGFPNQDLASLGENTRLAVKSFLDQPAAGQGESSLELLKGKAMFHMLPLLKYKDRSRLVETPTAVAGVRGTLFGLDVHAAGTTVTQAGGPPVRLAQAGAKDWVTLVYCFEGLVEVMAKYTGDRVNLMPGQRVAVTRRGLGPVGPIPREEGRRFLRDTLLDQAFNRGAAGWPLPGPGPADARGWAGWGGVPQFQSTSGGSTEVDPPQELTDLALQDQSPLPPPAAGSGGSATPPSGTPGALPPGPTDNLTGQGYFTTILANFGFGDSSDSAAVYVSTSLQDFGAGTVRADILSNTGYLDASAGFNNLELINLSGTEATLGSPIYDINITRTGSAGGYLDWGTWNSVSVPVYIGGNLYFLYQVGWWVNGVPTPASAIPGLGTFTYSGQAWGTFVGDPTLMAGTFTCDVYFSTAQIDDFELSVTNGTRSARIQNGEGTITGNSFTLNPAVGTWQLHQGTGSWIDANSRALNGTFYGPAYEHMAGAWGMYTNSSAAASGIFVGNR